MKKVGEVSDWFLSFSTCQRRGRVFHFSQSERKLVVAEVILGEEVELVAVQTGVDCKARYDDYIACCSFGDRVLVMAGREENVSAALVDVDEGRLSKETLHITTLTVSGDRKWSDYPFLCQVLENRALLYFDSQNSMWYCDVVGDTLTMRELKAKMPTKGGFHTVPVRLPDGKLLVAGACPSSSDITLISCSDDPRFENIGDILGVARGGTSSVLIGGRFVAGFGGNYGDLDDLWIFDLQTRRSSIVWEKGEWAPSATWPVLILQGDTLYIISKQVHSITLHALAELIDEDEVRDAFCDEFGLPRVPRYKLPPVDLGPPDGVCKFTTSLPCSSRNTLLYKGKILHFSSNGGELLVSELILHGRNKNFVALHTGVECKGDDIGCCLLGDRILVMSGRGNAVSAALLAVDGGRMGEETVHATLLTVAGDAECYGTPYLCQVSERRALLCFHVDSNMYYCDLEGDTLTMRILATNGCTEEGFKCLPVCLPGGKLLVAGSMYVSTDITLITCGEEPQFEKVGNIPGVGRSCPSMILLAERFVLGFGGLRDLTCLDDLWIFDLQTRRASIVWETEEWAEKASNAVLFVRDERLWILRNNVVAIPLRLISRRIEDDEIRDAFCGALGFPSAPRCSLPPPAVITSSGMVEIGGAVDARSYNTVQHRGRIFHFSLRWGGLVIFEIILYGRRAKMFPVHTGATLGDWDIGCCSLGDRILVMSRMESTRRNETSQGGDRGSNGEGFEVFAALVEVGDGRLSRETVHVTPLIVKGDKEWSACPFLCQVGENRALLYFDWRSSMWYCDVAGDTLIMRKLRTRMPKGKGFCTLPIRLSNGKLLVAGARPASTDITLISCDGEPTFERAGSIPGAERWGVSSVLFGNRFVIGFGELNRYAARSERFATGTLGEFWIFDLRSRKSFKVKEMSMGRPEDSHVPLVIQNSTLYVLGRNTYYIPLAALSDSIGEKEARHWFSWCVGGPYTPPPCFTRKLFNGYAPPCL